MHGLAAHDAKALGLFFAVKLRVARNHLKNLKKHLFIHIGVGVVVLGGLLFGGLEAFSFIFNWLLQSGQQPFGEHMLKRLVGLVLLSFFSMLTFSNLIIMLTTSYISREVEFYMAQPISHRRLFFMKFIESTVYSSWAFVILSLPFFVALGGTGKPTRFWRWTDIIPDAPLAFYPATFLLLVPYVVIPAALGAIIALLITTYFPARKMIRLAIVLGLMSVAITVATGRMAGMRLRWARRNDESVARVMNFMGLGDIYWMPSTWFARGIRASLLEDWREAVFWGALLLSTALMALQVCYWLVGRLYYRGFCSSRTSGGEAKRNDSGLYKFFDRALAAIPPQARALAVKDLTVFWRDPAQWGQLMILFGLLFIYVANLGSAAELRGIPVIRQEAFRSMTSLLTIGATCFILAILTTRFVYPMLSLEGKQQWVIGLAPLRRTRLVWVKYVLYWACSLALTFPMILLACFVLETDAFVTSLSLLTIVIMSLGLTSLAIGLGALMPNFQEDNPARIANGLGGTINVIISLMYTAVNTILEAPMLIAHIRGGVGGDRMLSAALILSVPLWIALHAFVIAYPMRLGLRNWRRLEF